MRTERHCIPLASGRMGDGKDVLTRLHRANIITDVLTKRQPVHAALQKFDTPDQNCENR